MSETPARSEEMGIRIETLESLEAAETLWKELNRTYMEGGLSLDWEAHRIIRDGYLVPRGHEWLIQAAMEADRCLGLFLFTRSLTDVYATPCWSFSDDLIIAREYFCDPRRVHEIVPRLAPHFADDLSCFYRPAHPDGFSTSPGGVIDLKSTTEEYLGSLRPKVRHNLRQNRARNADIRVEADGEVRWNAVQPVLDMQLEYWRQRKAEQGEAGYAYSRDKILCELRLMERAARMGQLLALYFYLKNKIVAVNFSVRRGAERVDDYLCLRDSGEACIQRGLGILAIQSNMDYCRGLGIRWYDMSACAADYKTRLINMESRFFYYPFPGIPSPGGEGGDESGTPA